MITTTSPMTGLIGAPRDRRIVLALAWTAILVCVAAPAHADATLDSMISYADAASRVDRAASFDRTPDTIVIQLAADEASIVRQALTGQHRPGDARGGDARRVDARGAVPRTGIDRLDLLLDFTHAIDIRPVFDLALDAERKRAHGLDRFFTVRFALPEGRTIAGVAGLYDRHAAIERAEVDPVYRVMARPDDALLERQWAHDNRGQAISASGAPVGTVARDLRTVEAWERAFRRRTVTLALIDTGLDLGHPEFAGRTLPGYDFVDDDDDPSDVHGHGTACAGVAAATGNNGIGIAGISWSCRLLPVRVLGDGGHGPAHRVARGVEFAVDHGARVLSLCFGGGPSMAMEAVLDYAAACGRVAVAAAGNRNMPQLSFPARYARVVAVGALSPCDQRKSTRSCDGESWWGSNYGPGLDFLAPGVAILTTDVSGAGGRGPGDYDATFNGTSAAAAHAAGLATLVWTVAPELDGREVVERLRMSCDDLGPRGVDTETGYGRLNAFAAVRFRGFDPVTRVWDEDRTIVEQVIDSTGGVLDQFEGGERAVGASCFLAGVVGTLLLVARRRGVCG